jgi:hypothetical protein
VTIRLTELAALHVMHIHKAHRMRTADWRRCGVLPTYRSASLFSARFITGVRLTKHTTGPKLLSITYSCTTYFRILDLIALTVRLLDGMDIL